MLGLHRNVMINATYCFLGMPMQRATLELWQTLRKL